MNDPSIEDWRKDLLLNPKGALLTLKIEDEVDFIELVLSLDAPLNYDNYNGSANNFYGKNHTEEYRAAHSKRFSGKGNPCYGKIMSEETKKKIGKANKGKIAWNLGKHHTEETRKKIREAAIGRVSPMKGKKLSAETIAKLTGRKHTEETKKMLSESRMGTPAPNGKRVTVDGIEYESLKKAMIKTGISLYKLRQILKEKV